MNSMPLVSVIVPVYNVSEYLERCVNSILNQSYQNLEIILVDDGSDDGSGELCDQYSDNDARIIAVHQENAGQSAARNTALRNAKGDYIAFLDSDDYWDQDMVDYLLGVMEEHHSQIAVCAVRHVGFPNIFDLEESDSKVNDYSGTEAAKLTLLGLKGFSGSACHAMFQKEIVLRELYFIEGHVYEDLDFMVRAMLNADIVSVSNLRKYNYCYRENNSSSLSSVKRIADLETVVEQMKQSLAEKHPDLLPMVEQRFISNGIYLLRSLNKEDSAYERLRNSILQYNPKKEMLTKSDWLLVNALRFGKPVFGLMDDIHRTYQKEKHIFRQLKTQVRKNKDINPDNCCSAKQSDKNK